MIMPLRRSTLLLLAGLCALAATAANARETTTITRRLPLAADGSVALSNVNGSIEITGWDQPEVDLVAEVSAPTADDLARIHVDIGAQPARVSIETRHERKGLVSRNSIRGEVHYKLRIPAGATLRKVEGVNSSVTLADLRGPVCVATVNGEVRATGLAADAKLSTVNGGITAAYAAAPAPRRISLETVNGSCTVSLPAEAGARLEASTVNGSISCDAPLTLDSRSRHELRGTIGQGRDQVSLESVNGSLHVVRG